MPHFKNTNNELFWLDAGDDPAKWLPSDCIQITDEETAAIRAASAPVVDPAAAIQAQIDALELQYLMPRATREFMLMFMEANAPAEVLAVNPGYQAVKAFDNQIVALRGQLP